METIRIVQSLASPALDSVALAITNFGHELTYVALLVIAYLVFDPVKGRRLGIYVLISFYLNGLLKGLFDTPRPFELDPEVLRSQAAAETAGGAGFPSGHAQGAATFWGIAALYLRRPWFTVAALIVIALVSLSRMYLGVHLPIDVVGGLLLGGILVALVPLLDRFEFEAPPVVQLLAGIGIPLVLNLVAPTPDSALILGGIAGFLTAPIIYRYRPAVTPSGRLVVGVLGLLLVFVALFGSSFLLPEEFKRHMVGGFLRYLAVAYVGLLAAPALYDLLRRSPRGDGYPAGE